MSGVVDLPDLGAEIVIWAPWLAAHPASQESLVRLIASREKIKVQSALSTKCGSILYDPKVEQSLSQAIVSQGPSVVFSLYLPFT